MVSTSSVWLGHEQVLMTLQQTARQQLVGKRVRIRAGNFKGRLADICEIHLHGSFLWAELRIESRREPGVRLWNHTDARRHYGLSELEFVPD